jgi:adenylate cyclase
MGTEIERKFTVLGDAWRSLGTALPIVQGYMTHDKERVVRVRTAGDQGFVTFKGISIGAVRSEFEYEIPIADARQILRELCFQPLIEKTRYRVPYQGMTWEVDEFSSPRHGLIIAEIELPSADHRFEIPDWIGDEVTGDPQYYNQNIR